MNAWSHLYCIVLCISLQLQVMCVNSLPQIWFPINVPGSSSGSSVNNSSNDKFKNAIHSTEVGHGCQGLCYSVQPSSSIKTRTERSVQGKVPQSGKNGPDSDSMRVFKYIHHDQFNRNSGERTSPSSKGSKIVTTTPPPSTTVDRSLIPNSFFAPQGTPTGNKTNVSATLKNNTSTPNKPSIPKDSPQSPKSIVIDAKIGLPADTSVSERPRRSPYPPRSALHRPPPPQGIRLPPPLPPGPRPVPLPLPYTQNIPTIDFENYHYGSSAYGLTLPSPQQEEPSQSIHYPTFNKKQPPPRRRLPPPPGHRGRRPPPPKHGHRPMPRPGPRPRPGGGSRHPTSHKPQYSYPKNAANIQDILNYFNENDNELQNNKDPLLIPPAPPKSSGDLSGVSVGGGSDFSKELHDVQTSLLKDIREFAKRPTLGLGNLESEPSHKPTMGNSASHHSKKHYRPESDYSDDFGYEEKPKPVRDMAKYSSHSPKTRERESEELNGNGSHYGKGRTRSKYSETNRERDSHHSRERERDESRERKRDESRERKRDESRERDRSPSHGHSHYSNREKQSEEKSNYRDRDLDSEERERFNRREKEKERNKNRQKSYASSSRINYKDLDDVKNSNEDRERERDRDREHYRDRDRSHSHATSHRRPPAQPIVIKRPYGHYNTRPDDYESLELYGKRPTEHTEYERPYSRDQYSSVPRVKAPSITYRPKKESYVPEYERSQPNSSPEYVEDIVEIHTDRPYRVDLKEREERERKAQLHKLYLEYLERKLEAEALTSTHHPVKKPPMRMKIHIYPNENSQTEQSKAVNYISAPAPGFTHHQHQPSLHSPIMSAPSRDISQTYPDPYQIPNNQRIQNLNPPPPMSTGGTGPQMMVDKNKNVVLHLHVHRRNGGFGEMGAGSEVYATTVKPLTYKEIYDDHQQQQMQQPYAEGEHVDNKSVSMELPIRDDKIEDVLHTLLQLRQQ